MAKPALASDVMIKTPDGSCDAVLTYPDGGGSWPGVILYPDALGLRPLMREMARRLADEGLCVLTVNQFYRS
ncbi:MAG: dienelactone hydrolase family protein, partial [Sinobacteraceae bacterium]|nr:dienelactone hydrolase family protein [Nevskiaceae bacterium]